MKNLGFTIFLLYILTGCITQDTKGTYTVRHYVPSDPKVLITGRVLQRDSIGIYWPATSIKLKFNGGTLKAHLMDERGDNYFNIVIDGDSIRHIKLDSAKKYYILAQGLPKGEHTIELIKRTEWDKGETWFYGLQLTDGELVDPGPVNKRVIEFYGNSITAGYAIEDNTGGDSPDSTFTNNYNTYAAITARHFNADLYCTVRSGIGITVSWFPLIMPEIYNRLDPSDSLSRWDFNKVTPQVVVINLLQNDTWLIKMPDHPSFKQRFGTTAPTHEMVMERYRDFVKNIRAVYPDAHIICALGSMDASKKGSPWPAYVSRVVKEMKDPKIHSLVFPHTGKPGHPRTADNAVMARQLIDFITEKVSW